MDNEYKLPEYMYLNYGSSVYGLTQPDSDIDSLLLLINANHYIDFPVHKDVEIWTVNQFEMYLKAHKLKALEIYYSNFDLFYNKLEMDFVVDKDVLRRSVSAVVSNAHVKAKKKIAQGDIYTGLKSYYHCIRILIMYTSLSKYGRFDPTRFKDELEPFYTDIMSFRLSDTPKENIFALLEAKYHDKLRELQTNFRLITPLANA